MTQNLSRRDLFKQAAIVLPVGIGFIAASGCTPVVTQSQADAFVGGLDKVVTAIQGALPIVSLFVPPPYGYLVAPAAGFLNLASTLTSNIVQEFASGDSSADQTKKVIGFISATFLDPSIIGKLPASFVPPSGIPINTQAFFVSVIKLLNDSIAQFAHVTPNAVVLPPTATNALNSISVASVATANINGGQAFPMSAASVVAMQGMAARLAVTKAVLSTLPK